MDGQNSKNIKRIEKDNRIYNIILQISPDSYPCQIARSHTYMGLKNILDSVKQMPGEFLEAKSPSEKAAFGRNRSILEDAVDILERENSKR